MDNPKNLLELELFIMEIIREDFIRSTCPEKKKQVTILSYLFLEHWFTRCKFNESREIIGRRIILSRIDLMITWSRREGERGVCFGISSRGTISRVSETEGTGGMPRRNADRNSK